MALTPGQKVGLVAVAGIGAFLLAGGGGAKAAVSTPPIDPCIDPKDCKTLTDCAQKIMASATKDDVPTLKDMLVKATKLGCSDLAKQIGTLITTLSGGGVIPIKTGTITFAPSKAKDPTRAHNLAVAFGTAKVPGDWASAHPGDVASDGTFKDWAAYGRYNNATPSARFAMTQFQDAAGLSTDGFVGNETLKALNYWWGSTSVGGEACVGGECSACMGKRPPFETPESLGGASTMPSYEKGYTKVDRVFGSQFGAGPSSGPLARYRAFGVSTLWGR